MNKGSLSRAVALILVLLVASGCSSIQKIGNVGSTPLSAYVISHTDFFSANRMLIILDENGKAVAATGGTVAGPGPIAAGLAGSAIIGSGVAYAGSELRKGLQSTDVTVKGIPKALDVSGDVSLSP